MKKLWQGSGLFFLVLGLAACGQGRPQVTPTVAPTNTPTPESTRIADQPSQTPIIRLTNTATLTVPPSRTFTPQPPTGTPSSTPRPTNTATRSASTTPRPTNTATITVTNTPTFTPSATFTRTPTYTPSPTVLPSPTPFITSTPTNTQPPTNTPTITATNTRVPPSFTPSATFTLTPSDTPTITSTPLPTRTPLVAFSPTPSRTPTLLPTLTATNTPTATNTLLPSQTPSLTNTFTPTFTATFDTTAAAATLNARATERQLTLVAENPPTWTPAPTNAPTRTIMPTLNATPTFITATPSAELGIVNTPVTSTPQVVENAPTTAPQATPTPLGFTPTPLPPEIVQQGFLTPIPPPPQVVFNSANISTFNFQVGPGQPFTFNGATVTGGVVKFASNPRFEGSFAYTDTLGNIRFAPPGGGEEIMGDSPFHQGYETGSASSNKNFVSDLGWAPNGQWFYFIVSPAPGTDNNDAGVWFWQPEFTGSGRTFLLLRDCYNGLGSCGLFNASPWGEWRSIKAQFSPNSAYLLVTLNLISEGRQAIAVVPVIQDPNFARNLPNIVRYDSGRWLSDGRLLVSGRRPSDGRVVVAITDTSFSYEEILLDATGANLWMQDAVQRSDGTIVALGRECCPGGALRLYQIADGVATPISEEIGGGTPSRVDWSAGNGEVTVTVGGAQYRVNATSGGIRLFREVLGTSAEGAPVLPDYPTTVVPGSRYTAGQQVQFIGTSNRNLRSLPTLNAGIVDFVAPNEFVGIIAGPWQADGYEWWYISNARSVQGWVASTNDGVSLLSP